MLTAKTSLPVLFLVLFPLTASQAFADEAVATGTVFVDKNGNHALDADESGLAGVSVSNSRDVVQTDANGRYSLPVDDDSIVFMARPIFLSTTDPFTSSWWTIFTG